MERLMDFEIIAEVENRAQARALITALRGYGFHPLDEADGGLPGVRGMFAGTHIPVQVPTTEAADAAVLAQDLLRAMAADDR
jgi:hypothetical protein